MSKSAVGVALVTGATGFIGGHLVRYLVERGQPVRALVRAGSDLRGLPEAVQRAVGDITDEGSVRAALDRVETVYHLASLLKVPWKPAFTHVNVEGVAVVARAAAASRRPPRLVLVSSLAAAGPCDRERPRDERDPVAPVSRYGRVKLAGEEAAVAVADRVPLTIARPPMVFGEHDRGALGLFRTAARGVHLVPTWRTERVGLIHARDLAVALALLAERGERVSGLAGWSRGEGVYHVATEEQPTYAELGRRVGRACGVERVRALPLPSAVTWLAALGGEVAGRLRDQPTILNTDKFREAVGGSWIARTDKLRALGFAPEAAVDARLAQTAAWYRAEGWI